LSKSGETEVRRMILSEGAVGWNLEMAGLLTRVPIESNWET